MGAAGDSWQHLLQRGRPLELLPGPSLAPEGRARGDRPSCREGHRSVSLFDPQLRKTWLLCHDGRGSLSRAFLLLHAPYGPEFLLSLPKWFRAAGFDLDALAPSQLA